MGPRRTVKALQQGEPSTSNAEGSVKRQPRRNHTPKEPVGVPGVQKVKSALRQAKRLLAKEKLAANVRVETERRIKALEADLEEAQASKKERDIAVRYHKVKFFGACSLRRSDYWSLILAVERQKVVRKLNQTKKRLESADASSKPQLTTAIAELRVDLNYILANIREDPASSETPVPKVNPNSEEVRSWIRGRMEAGEISLEPELHLDSREPKPARRSTAEWGSKKKSGGTTSKEVEEEEPEDAFFGDDAEDDSE
ncbi:hypothetical protein DXG01_010941 [Tephrocybe rancida]|nr:hypothetical protein DXG01_010941 [Tephrocybe rancida]